MSMPLRPGRDVLSLLHRDLGAHLLLGATPYQLLCQYLANADSPTHACEGNVHHGDAAARRFPMMSHLGKMLSVVVGGTWAARRNGEQVFGLAVIGDGGTSTGEFHESLNIASVHKVPVLFLIQNNHYAFSTPTSVQNNCQQLSDRACWRYDTLLAEISEPFSFGRSCAALGSVATCISDNCRTLVGLGGHLFVPN